MTQADFIQAVQVKMGDDTSKALIKRVLDAAGSVSLELVKSGEKADLCGLGKVGVVKRAARKGRNPKTGATINIPAKNALKYTPSKAAKDAVN